MECMLTANYLKLAQAFLLVALARGPTQGPFHSLLTQEHTLTLSHCSQPHHQLATLYSTLSPHPPKMSSSNNSNPKRSFNWPSFLLGATATAAATTLLTLKPKDPTFELISIDLTSFRLNSFPSLDAELILTVHLTNPNIITVHYNSATMSIFYDGSLLGSARLEAGSQTGRSCKLLRLPARLSGLELVSRHVSRFLSDVAKREMVLDAALDVEGKGRVMWRWEHGFRVHVESRVAVDPVFLDVIDQDNKAEMELFVSNT